jgi:multicomponent Na+:H+ antiporter subunit F
LVYVLLLFLVAAAMVGFYRLLAGPTKADRVIAFDLLFAVSVVLCICASLASGSTAFLDVAIGLSLVGFLATIAWARLIDRQLSSQEHNE